MVNNTTMTSINQLTTLMHAKMCSNGRPVDEISEFLLFNVTDGGHFGFYALENYARLFKRGVGVYFFYKYLKLPKTTVKCYLQKVGHGIMVLDPTSKELNPVSGGSISPPTGDLPVLVFIHSFFYNVHITRSIQIIGGEETRSIFDYVFRPNVVRD